MKPLDALNAFGSLLITLLVFPRALGAAESDPADHLVTITDEGGVSYGSVDGFLQTAERRRAGDVEFAPAHAARIGDRRRGPL